MYIAEASLIGINIVELLAKYDDGLIIGRERTVLWADAKETTSITSVC